MCLRATTALWQKINFGITYTTPLLATVKLTIKREVMIKEETHWAVFDCAKSPGKRMLLTPAFSTHFCVSFASSCSFL